MLNNQTISQRFANSSTRIVIIGDLDKWRANGKKTEDFDGITFLRLDQLDAEALRKHAPDVIFSPLICDISDAVEIATRLVAIGYRGRYRALSGGESAQSVVLAEIAEIAPDLDFDILDISEP